MMEGKTDKTTDRNGGCNFMEENELLEETRRTNQLLRRTLLWTRITAVLLAAMLAAVLLCMGGISRGIQQISKDLEGIDFSPIINQLAALDMSAVNDTLQSLSNKLDEVDMGVLNEAIANMNRAVEALQNASDTIKSWSENLSRGLAGLFNPNVNVAPSAS